MILKGGTMESKKYIVVKNHVREIAENEVNANTEALQNVTEETDTPKNLIKSKKDQTSSEEGEDANVISENDVQSLLSAYNNCKEVITKIETKYGHILNLNNNENDCDNSRKRKYGHNQYNNYSSNKRFRYDNSSHSYQTYQPDYQYNNYNMQSPYNYYRQRYVHVENESDHQLPETMVELDEMLKDETMPMSLRYRVIEKMKYIRQENLNILRFEKKNMIQKLKSNPDEYFSFKGSNLSSLEGYPE